HTRFSRDWSSDVCSSDLDFTTDEIRIDRPLGTMAYLTRDFKHEFITNSFRDFKSRGIIWIAYHLQQPLAVAQIHENDPSMVPAKIGRASCRERVQSPEEP